MCGCVGGSCDGDRCVVMVVVVVVMACVDVVVVVVGVASSCGVGRL